MGQVNKVLMRYNTQMAMERRAEELEAEEDYLRNTSGSGKLSAIGA